MNIKLFVFLLLAVLLLSSKVVYTQHNTLEEDEEEDDQQKQNNNDDDIEIIEEKDEVNRSQDQQNFQKFELNKDGETSIEDQIKQFQQQQEQMQAHLKNMYAICIILSNGQINQDQEDYKSIIQGTADSQKLYQKIEAEHITTCMEKVKPQEAQQLAEEMNSGSFDAKNWGQIFMELTTDRYRDPSFNLELTDSEKEANKFATEIKAEWGKLQKDEQGNQGNQGSDNQFNQQQNLMQDFEMKLFNFSLKDMSSGTKSLLILSVVAVFVGLIFLGLKEIQKANQPFKSKKQLKKESKKQK